MIIKQIRSNDGTGTLSYVVLDPGTNEGIIIDPNIEDTRNLLDECYEAGARIAHIVDTHTHADHVTGAGELKKALGANIIMHENTKHKWKVVDQGDRFGIGDILRANAAIAVDRYVNDGDVLTVGSLHYHMLFTPGHTDNHLTVLVGDAVFTGDLLLIGQAGRSDLPGGNPEQQYESIFTKILPLPDDTRMYPGHDYNNNEFSYLRDEKRNNPFLSPRSKEEYVAFVKNFFPPLAEASAAGGKMTLQCGTQRVMQSSDAVRSITPERLAERLQQPRRPLVLDVREPFELAMVGAIEGMVNIPVGQLPNRLDELPEDRDVEIVCVCQSGARSLEAAHLLTLRGYRNVWNLERGTAGWVRLGLPVHRKSHVSP